MRWKNYNEIQLIKNKNGLQCVIVVAVGILFTILMQWVIVVAVGIVCTILMQWVIVIAVGIVFTILMQWVIVIAVGIVFHDPRRQLTSVALQFVRVVPAIVLSVAEPERVNAARRARAVHKRRRVRAVGGQSDL